MSFEDIVQSEIENASNTIDKALLTINPNNRGEVAVRILTVVRNLNDNFALKLWNDLFPTNPNTMVNKAASKFNNVKNYKFIALFDKYLQKSVSHFTPSEDGGERLMIKYYHFLLQIKKVAHEKYKMNILQNINLFLEDIDEQTLNFYKNIAGCIERNSNIERKKNLDNYYIYKIKPFYINDEIYYEIVLSLARDNQSKFNRITAYTKCNITTCYAVSLEMYEFTINEFGIDFPINIIFDWNVSIRPCEIDNFAKLLNINCKISRASKEYVFLMNYLKEFECSLLDIIDYSDLEYELLKTKVKSVTNIKSPFIFKILDECRFICKYQNVSNLIRYLLVRLNNVVIKDQYPDYYNSRLLNDNYHISSKCFPFEKMPYYNNLRKHKTIKFDLFESIDISGHEEELFANYLKNNAENKGVIYNSLKSLEVFGDESKIESYIRKFNNKAYPDNEKIQRYKNNVYIKKYEENTIFILENIKKMSMENSNFQQYFLDQYVEDLCKLEGNDKLDDELKYSLLCDLVNMKNVLLIYGAAGTGKTRLIKHIAQLLDDKNIIFLSKTNAAVLNLRQKICNNEDRFEFVTVDYFIRKYKRERVLYDLIVLDECSTVDDQTMAKLIECSDSIPMILAGDTYQIESIGYGNWFKLCEKILPKECIIELDITHRSKDTFLTDFWKEVRNMKSDNVAMELMIKNNYSHVIDDDIFSRKSKDEIILCLNYNGLYGLNNINKLMQCGNVSKGINLGPLTFKINDPVLFNDSERFELLNNNLKGVIEDIEDFGDYVDFTVRVFAEFSKQLIDSCGDDLIYIDGDDETTLINFKVNKTKPYENDSDDENLDHVVPFQVAYAVSIHKSQGLEYESVKIIISDESEEQITHSIFYTAITRSKKYLNIYWSPEVSNRVLNRIKPQQNEKDWQILKNKIVF